MRPVDEKIMHPTDDKNHAFMRPADDSFKKNKSVPWTIKKI